MIREIKAAAILCSVMAYRWAVEQNFDIDDAVASLDCPPSVQALARSACGTAMYRLGHAEYDTKTYVDRWAEAASYLLEAV